MKKTFLAAAIAFGLAFGSTLSACDMGKHSDDKAQMRAPAATKTSAKALKSGKAASTKTASKKDTAGKAKL